MNFSAIPVTSSLTISKILSANHSVNNSFSSILRSLAMAITYSRFAGHSPRYILLYIGVLISNAEANCLCNKCFSSLKCRILSANNIGSNFNCMTFLFLNRRILNKYKQLFTNKTNKREKISTKATTIFYITNLVINNPYCQKRDRMLYRKIFRLEIKDFCTYYAHND